MPCPLFLPAIATCAAQPGAILPESMLRSGCNPGYARAICPCAAAIEADAARFLIKSDIDGIIEVAWSLERNHHPLAVGTIPVAAAKPPQTTLEHQAYALASDYRKGK